MEDRAYLRRAEAARYLQERYGAYTAETLAKLACIGGGPRFQKVGPYPLYRPEDLDAWIASRMTGPVAHNSELASPKGAEARQSAA
jgi:hypothetical protein